MEDKNLPSGWKVATGTNELGAPDGSSVTTREDALVYMFQGNYSAKEIKDMILSLKFEGWKSNQHIPVGWLCKEKSFRNEQGLNTYIVSISSSGQLFHSISAVLEHMQSSTDYTHDQIKAIERHFLKKNSRKKINHEIWSDDASLPPGWKWKIAEGKTNKVFCLPPDGSQSQSRKPSSVNIIKNNHNEEAIVEMKKT